METVILRSSKSPAGDTMPVGALSHTVHEVSLTVAELSTKEVADLQRDARVLGAAPSVPMRLVRPVENEASATPAMKEGWGIHAVGAAMSDYTGDGVTVAVLDTGIDQGYAHSEAFKGVEIERENFTREPNWDLHGHGTHCAGTILGRTTKGCRIGVAPGVTRALIGKVLGEGGGTSGAVLNAILWAYRNDAQIISLSLGIDFVGLQESLAAAFPPHLSHLATSLALSGYAANVRLFDRLSRLLNGQDGLTSGAVIVAAAGNESRRDIDPRFRVAVAPPAVGDQILSVGAVDRLGTTGPDAQYKVAWFSNRGPRLCAPGVNIVSAWLGGGLSRLSGTSMATPHVAGVAALWAEHLARQERPFRAAEVVDQIVRSALALPDLDPDDVGLGLAQAP